MHRVRMHFLARHRKNQILQFQSFSEKFKWLELGVREAEPTIEQQLRQVENAHWEF